jgi:hypothetical protein
MNTEPVYLVILGEDGRARVALVPSGTDVNFFARQYTVLNAYGSLANAIARRDLENDPFARESLIPRERPVNGRVASSPH